MPGNAAEFFGFLLPVISFDAIKYLFGDIFQIDFPDDAPIKGGIFDQMEDLGYETSSALFALGTVALLTAIYLLRVVYFAMVAIVNWFSYHKYENYTK